MILYNSKVITNVYCVFQSNFYDHIVYYFMVFDSIVVFVTKKVLLLDLAKKT